MKAMTKHKALTLILFTSLVYCWSGCEKMDSSYREYIQGGEIIYANKADSLKTYPGKNRLKLTFVLSPTSNVKRAMIYWNNRADSMEHIIQRAPGTKSVSISISNLPEGAYSFDVYTFDDTGNSSVKTNVTGNVYGETYAGLLENKRMDAAIVVDQNVVVEWTKVVNASIGTEVVYTDKQGNEQTVVGNSADEQTILTDYKPDTEIKYRTLYIPEPTSIDTFTTAFVTVIPGELLDKLKFKRWNTVDFPYTEYGSTYNIERLWDEVYTGYGYMYKETLPLPRSFTFDMGQVAVLKKLKLTPNWSNQLYKNGNVKKFQIWGSSSPDVTEDFSTWKFLGEFNSYKPSGLPLGQTTNEDLEYAKNGEDFFIASTEPIRYIRFVVQETWNPANEKTMHITELTFWGNKQ